MDTQPYKTAQEHAYSFLREAILSGKYPGGMRVNIPEVAERLGMSRMPVREALRQLDTEGLVTIRPNRGVVVTELTPEDILEVFEMRAVLEGLAVRVALPRFDDEAFEDLARIHERMDRNRGNAAQWLRLHNEFHDYICRKSGRPRLVAQTTLLRRTVEPYLRVHIGAYESEELLGSEHQRLLETLRARDPERAERAMREHVERSAAHVVAFLKTATPSAPHPVEPARTEGGRWHRAVR
jgi:DNA-binding GntR family transcriptional regulator